MTDDHARESAIADRLAEVPLFAPLDAVELRHVARKFKVCDDTGALLAFGESTRRRPRSDIAICYGWCARNSAAATTY
jgi:hypothetical protein